MKYKNLKLIVLVCLLAVVTMACGLVNTINGGSATSTSSVDNVSPVQVITQMPTSTQLTTDNDLIHQWASSATASSEFSSPSWDASQATGRPNVNECIDDSSAWASSPADTVEWIELTYDIPVVPTEINIYQSYNPSQVVEVRVTDTNGAQYVAWSGNVKRIEACPYLMTINVQLDKEIRINKVQIVIDQSILGTGWNEIDAVELVGKK